MVILLWKLPLVEDHQIFWTLRLLILLSVDPLPEDKTQLELQRLALRAHQEARQAADLRHDMAKRTMPSDGPYKPGDKVFVWSSPVNANAIASKAWKKERWIRGTVISQEGAMVNVHVDRSHAC